VLRGSRHGATTDFGQGPQIGVGLVVETRSLRANPFRLGPAGPTGRQGTAVFRPRGGYPMEFCTSLGVPTGSRWATRGMHFSLVSREGDRRQRRDGSCRPERFRRFGAAGPGATKSLPGNADGRGPGWTWPSRLPLRRLDPARHCEVVGRHRARGHDHRCGSRPSAPAARRGPDAGARTLTAIERRAICPGEGAPAGGPCTPPTPWASRRRGTWHVAAGPAAAPPATRSPPRTGFAPPQPAQAVIEVAPVAASPARDILTKEAFEKRNRRW